MVSCTFVVADDAVPTNALQDVVVRVFSEDGATFVTQGTTDEDGELVLELEDATTYWVRFFKIGYQFESKLLVDADSGASSNVFDVEAVDLVTLPPSTVPCLCRASGYVRGADYAPRAGIRITFSLTGKPRVVAGEVLVVQDVITVSDAHGWVEVELVRDGVYDCVVDGIDDAVYRVIVPDRTSVRLTELVWPYVAALSYSEGGEDVDALELAVDGSITLDATVTLSSGVTTPYELDDGATRSAGDFVTLTVSDPAVASAMLSGDVLTVVGHLPGTAVVTAAVAENVETCRIPEPTRTFSTLTIVVSE